MSSLKGQLVYINSINQTLKHGGIFHRDFSHIVGTTTEINDHIEAGSYPGFNDTYDLYEVLVDDVIYFLHEDDCEVIKIPEHNQLDFSDIPGFEPGQCCSNPTILKNSALGDIFFVCTNCKKEVNEGGKLC